ncbi:MAG TPA: glutamine--fructose-6-phosphate transaminase (isomerizing) [Candidatus Dojkabacteria bacterium]|nr:glutamine--fructose-6-phosphate transaminase (isomerizing) [Candidatus Dojkabacteria bacterium]
MCGIFGYSGKRDAAKTIIDGLKRLEYRGYDSWGVAVVSSDKIDVVKKVGAIGDLSSLSKLPSSTIGIGHTRWATHGGVTNYNAHPHYSTDKSFVVAQNGIVENYQELKEKLTKKGYIFSTQTDTEVIVRLIEDKLKKEKELFKAIRSAFLDLEGRNTIIVLPTSNSHIYAVRNGSPLVVGIGKDEVFIASDTLSFADKTDKVVYINNNEMVSYHGGEVSLYDVKSGKELKTKISKLEHDDISIAKEGYDHFMIKEIVEQRHTIREAVQYSLEELTPLLEAIKKSRNVYTVGAGTANFAAGQIAFYLRRYAHINAIELKSYEMESFKDMFSNKDLILAISQSGETADTIEALEFAKAKGAKVASLVNMLGSTITRMSDYPYFSRSGPEICVASTKAFTAQISWGYLLAKSLTGKYSQARKDIEVLAEKLQNYFNKKLFSQMQLLAKKMAKHEHFFVLGKGQNYYIALEGALKVKEITYKHFEGFAAGELKHGVIALIDKGTPVFVIVSEDENKNDMMSSAAEVKARGAFVIGIAKKSNELFNEFIKTIDASELDPIANVIPFQLLSYFLGVSLGNSPDKPRNLAKSVTVK